LKIRLPKATVFAVVGAHPTMIASPTANKRLAASWGNG